MTSGAVYVLVVNFGPSGQQWQFGFATMATDGTYVYVATQSVPAYSPGRSAFEEQ